MDEPGMRIPLGTTSFTTLLGFDPGGKRIGVAVGQTLTNTANPLETIAVKHDVPDWKAIDRLINTWEPDGLVVGLPLNMDGTEQAMTLIARQFRNQLARRYRLPVYVTDERLSTREARERLACEGRLDDADDPVAAQVILETWFSECKDHNKPAFL
uniref:Putative pre-16S rRNA nuclease n=1 Tax=Candidatus Kentrum sp. MB TaxID=2138164 RepID=A0A450XGK2_9GAMM|nr:MAG: putative holliday junction resolvase [Candidatus Kentron sp. MB]VFK28318.1 MAG: putative holliday junction resolvase [Candidatus Kentron sp. MB]VFK74203.1 MAG: putative holliday junction resolvase [Candidatus Kentron sp. MB]